MTTKLVFFGGGNMAEAIFAGLSTNPEFIIEVIQRNPEKAARLQKDYPNIIVQPSLGYKLATHDILILAIKPQQAKEACLPIKDLLSNCLIVSVMAGLSITTIANWLNNNRIIRTMPNTPARVKQGVTAIYSSSEVNLPEQQIIEQIFSGLGLVYLAKDETEVDKMIPLSGSAIGFVYYFMEGIIKVAVNQFGFSDVDATTIMKQVINGSSALLDANPEISISEQRRLVTSKKGTTEQGIMTFEREQFHEIIQHAMQDCYNRALSMAHEFK